MKKFLGILLTLSIICSLIIVPATTVSAAEEVLFESLSGVEAFDYSDMSNITKDEIDNVKITTGGANIYI